MNLGLRGSASFLVAFSLVLGCGAWSFADDTEPTRQLSLVDLTKYRAALAGKATAEDAKSSDTPVRVSFKDLWNRPDTFRGRRVTIQGRAERIFRQDPVGSFPALAEIWIASPAGDPSCLVVPQESGTGISPEYDHGLEGRATPPQIPKLGQTVRFTGTFLKMIRYAAGDGARLAPLVVGNLSPFPVQEAIKANSASSSSADNIVGQSVRSPVNWLLGLTLALLAAGSLAWRHLRLPPRRQGLRDYRRRRTASMTADPPLEFIEPHDEP
jgi:hypothetical protein